MKIFHIPVLYKEIIENLHISSSITNIVDCTLGEGGISKEILDEVENAKITGIDTDLTILKIAKERLKSYNNIEFIHENYKNIKSIKSFSDTQIHNIIFDFGLSNFHLRNIDKAFSFDSSNKLDMRFDDSENLTAHTVINKYSKTELMEILVDYADFPSNSNTTKFVEYIVQKRPIDTCEDLKKICLNFYRNLSYKRAIHNITRIFQAIRIEVNNEYENVKNGLENALSLIECEGRVFTITYHSGEDRIVKNIFNKYKLSNESSKRFKIVNKKVIKPKYTEQKSNSNSKSAKLRIIERIL